MNAESQRLLEQAKRENGGERRGRPAKPQRAERKTRDLWTRTSLSTRRVDLALKFLGVDRVRFVNAYESAPCVGGRTLKPPSSAAVAAVTEFQRTGDWDALQRALPGKNAAERAIGRVVRWQAQQRAGNGK